MAEGIADKESKPANLRKEKCNIVSKCLSFSTFPQPERYASFSPAISSIYTFMLH